MTKREVEERLVSLRPKPAFVPSIRKRPSVRTELPPSAPAAPLTVIAPPLAETQDFRPPPRPSPSILQPATPSVYNFRF
ncbi:MAG TPA: hypothetical protein VIG29_10930, partial [Vicinamibacteria bacterium]